VGLGRIRSWAVRCVFQGDIPYAASWCRGGWPGSEGRGQSGSPSTVATVVSVVANAVRGYPWLILYGCAPVAVRDPLLQAQKAT